jgi:hypothetical protein
MNWTKWVPITEEVNSAEEQNDKKGVYRVRATSKPGIPQPIIRRNGVDLCGVMYIGEGILRDRIGRLSHICENAPKHSHHDFIENWYAYKLDLIAYRNNLEVQWAECQDYEDEEHRLLDEYREAFGELPPGNKKG